MSSTLPITGDLVDDVQMLVLDPIPMQLRKLMQTQAPETLATVFDSLMECPCYGQKEVGWEWVNAMQEACNALPNVAGWRKYADALRIGIAAVGNFRTDTLLPEHKADMLMVLTDIKNHLYLAQTQPENNLAKWWLDEMTGEVDPEANFEMEVAKAAAAVLNPEYDITPLVEAERVYSEQYAGRAAPQIIVREESLEQRITEQYADPEMAKKAIDALRGGFSEDELLEEGDDRPFTPSSLIKSWKPNMAAYPADAVSKFKAYLRKRIRQEQILFQADCHPGMTKRERSALWMARMTEMHSSALDSKAWAAFRIAIQDACEDDDWRDEDNPALGIQAAAIAIWRATDSYEFQVDDTFDFHPDLPAVFDIFEDEIAEQAIAGSCPSARDELFAIPAVDEFIAETDEVLDQAFPAEPKSAHIIAALVANGMDIKKAENTANLANSKGYNAAYMNAVAGGLTIAEAEQSAWEGFRRQLNPIANERYHAVLKETGDPKRAMAAFWQSAKPAEVLTISRSGVRLMEGNGTERMVPWRLFATKMRFHEVAMGAEKATAILNVLTSQAIQVPPELKDSLLKLSL